MAIGRLKAGVAELELSVMPCTELIGDLGPRPMERVETSLMARALILSSGDVTLVLVTLDLFGLPDYATAELVAAIASVAGVRPEAVLVVCSHTRGAPYTVAGPGRADVDTDAIAAVIAAVPAVVQDAQDRMEDASFGVGRIILPHLVYNHRLLTRNMRAISAWMGVPRDEVLEPEGPSDPEFLVGVVRDRNGHPLCLLWNCAADNRFADGGALSAGLPGLVQQVVDERLRRHVPLLYLGGCSGNISFTYDQEPTVDLVASAIMAAQLETSCDPMVRLGCASERMILPIRDYSEFWSKADIELKAPHAVEAFARELDHLREEGAHAVPATVQAFRLGRVALIGIPGIPFAELGLQIKQSSPARSTLIVGNTGGYVGYVLPRSAFEAGGFETWSARSARIGPGAGEFLIEQSASLLHDLWQR